MGSALDAAIAEQPGFNTLEVCGVLGGLAGIVVAQSLPDASSEVDEIHLDAMTRAFRSTLLELLVQAREVEVTALQSETAITATVN